MDQFWLTDEQFARIAPHLPTDTRGKERVDDRRVTRCCSNALPACRVVGTNPRTPDRLGPTAPVILLLVAGFRMPGYVASAMAIPLFKHQGFSNTDIATVTKLFGFWIALGGTFLAGALIPRIGMLPSLLIGTVAGSASHLSLAYLAAHGGDGGTAFWTFAVAVSIDGFASVVLITYMSTLASADHAASQFGLLTSLCAFPGSVLAGFSGFAIEHTGFTWFFVGTSLIGLPVALLAVYVWAKVGISDEAAPRPNAP